MSDKCSVCRADKTEGVIFSLLVVDEGIHPRTFDTCEECGFIILTSIGDAMSNMTALRYKEGKMTLKQMIKEDIATIKNMIKKYFRRK